MPPLRIDRTPSQCKNGITRRTPAGRMHAAPTGRSKHATNHKPHKRQTATAGVNARPTTQHKRPANHTRAAAALYHTHHKPNFLAEKPRVLSALRATFGGCAPRRACGRSTTIFHFYFLIFNFFSLLMSLRCAAKTYVKIHASGRSRGRMDTLCKFSTFWPSF